jgi:hypothetical protein
MRKILFVLVVFALLPVFSLAHGGTMMNFGELQTGPEMMEYVEDSVMGEELHEEMEQLMVRMMSGKMTQNEAGRITELMGQYPGPYGMMMNRLGGPSSGEGGSSSWNMMNMMSGWNGMMGWGGLWLLIFTLGWLVSWLVWIAAGVLLVVWLAKKAFSSLN